MTGRVLVVDDEPNIVFLVESALELAGYQTEAADCGHDALAAVDTFSPDVVVLDVMLPDIDGFTVLRRLRDRGSRVPVIFLTARDATDDRVRGLTIGGDDYMVKPFAVAELVARIALALRRRGLDGPDDALLRCADLEIDDDAHRVLRAGRPVSLSPTEYKLLRYLLLNAGRVLSRAQILDSVWDGNFAGDPAVVDTFISYLRRKVDRVEPKLIHTVRGVGFCLREGLMSLRTRLALGIGAVLATLAVSMVVVVQIQREYLIEQLDRQLRAALPFAVMGPPPALPPNLPNLPNLPDRLGEGGTVSPVTNLYVGRIENDGHVTDVVTGSLLDDAPEVPTDDLRAAGDGLLSFDVDGRAGQTRFRVLAARRAADESRWRLVALPLTETDAAMRRLVLTLGIAAALIVAALVVTGWWIVRLGLRPIAQVTEAADAIAAGERGHRVPLTDDRTEAGRLGRAFNVMLDERDEGEARLRQFVADASHELRTPLTSIRGYLEVYRQGGFRPPADTGEMVQRMWRESARMQNLVEDLLLLAKLDQGRPLARDEVDLADVLRDAADDGRAIQPARRLLVDLPGEPDLMVVGDEPRLRQVVAELVHNALVHTPPEAAIRLRGERRNGDVCVAVADTGPGLAPEVAARVFDRFYRGDPSRSRHAGGSGLGLPIARSLVEAHRGTVTLLTGPGHGCTFRILLPARPETPPAHAN